MRLNFQSYLCRFSRWHCRELRRGCAAPPFSFSFVFMCVFSVVLLTAYVLYYCNTVGWTWWDWGLILRTLSSFSALTLLVGSFDPYKPVPDMTYNVFGGTLNFTQPVLSRFQLSPFPRFFPGALQLSPLEPLWAIYVNSTESALHPWIAVIISRLEARCTPITERPQFCWIALVRCESSTKIIGYLTGTCCSVP